MALIDALNGSQMVTKARVLDLKEVKVFVLDEADNMLESGSMGDQSIQLKKCVIPALPSPLPVLTLSPPHSLITKLANNPQIVLFSATFAEVVRTFAVRFAPAANEIKLKQEELSLDAIKQFFMGASSSFPKHERERGERD
jgi:ATP-dependent RNA helicase DDX19/DBP5